MFSEKVSMWSQHWINISDILHDVLHCPQVGVLTAGPRALSETAWAWGGTGTHTHTYIHLLLMTSTDTLPLPLYYSKKQTHTTFISTVTLLSGFLVCKLIISQWNKLDNLLWDLLYLMLMLKLYFFNQHFCETLCDVHPLHVFLRVLRQNF